MLNVCIVGLGAWGSALGMTAHRAGSKVTFIGQSAEVMHIRRTGCFPAYKDARVPSTLLITESFEPIASADLVALVVPAQSLRSCVKHLKRWVPNHVPFVIASKGIEISTGFLMGEVFEDTLFNPYAILSGPNFASEIIDNKPTATTIGCRDKHLGQTIVRAFAHPHFRPYVNPDIVGVQMGGALKNVIAIACGMAQAQNFGENAVASLITRGLHEIKEMGVAKDAQATTFLGLSGVGDMVLTCMGSKSRNVQFGADVARDPKILTNGGPATTVEGFYTTKAVYELSERLGVEMPISKMVYRVLYEGYPIAQSMTELLERPLRDECSAHPTPHSVF